MISENIYFIYNFWLYIGALNDTLVARQQFVEDLQAKIAEYESIVEAEETKSAQERDKLVDLTRKLKALAKSRKDLKEELEQLKSTRNSENNSMEESSKIISELQDKIREINSSKEKLREELDFSEKKQAEYLIAKDSVWNLRAGPTGPTRPGPEEVWGRGGPARENFETESAQPEEIFPESCIIV